MRQSKFNPSRNKLPPGIKEPALVQAIEISGYPLQGVTAAKLLGELSVTEEWGYIDRDSQEHRTLDVFAFKALTDDKLANIQPLLIMLIECKRSEHPYVFFQNVTDRQIPRFPYIAGLQRGIVSIHERSGNRMQECPGDKALGLNALPFVQSGPPRCCAFSKAQPSGDKVRLSGSEPFNKLILPLIKASDHAADLYRSDPRPSRLFPALIVCVSVLDSPMMLVENPSKASDPMLMPWARVSRQEANRDRQNRLRYHFYAIDAVHIEFLDKYVSEKLLPFAREFGHRAVQMEEILFKGGTVANLDNWTWEEIKPK